MYIRSSLETAPQRERGLRLRMEEMSEMENENPNPPASGDSGEQAGVDADPSESGCQVDPSEGVSQVDPCDVAYDESPDEAAFPCDSSVDDSLAGDSTKFGKP